jgi:hypothetical protein
MSRKVSETTDTSAMTGPAPEGAGFSQKWAAKAVRMEHWESSFDDHSDDWSEFRLFDTAGNLFSVKRVQAHKYRSGLMRAQS